MTVAQLTEILNEMVGDTPVRLLTESYASDGVLIGAQYPECSEIRVCFDGEQMNIVLYGQH